MFFCEVAQVFAAKITSEVAPAMIALSTLGSRSNWRGIRDFSVRGNQPHQHQPLSRLKQNKAM